MTTFATLFSGGELAGVGMRNAGLVHRWGIELDDDIANVARTNGFNVITADVLDIDPATMEPVDCLHVSPPCTRASTANQSVELNDDGTKEAPLDVAMGEKVAEFIDVLQPRVFTLENVYQYRNFKAFKVIIAALERNGYMYDFANLNAADFGVAQTRRRLILRAVRGALLPMLPAPERWVGWLEAIEDLVPSLPDSQFAKWQLARLNFKEIFGYESTGEILPVLRQTIGAKNFQQWVKRMLQGLFETQILQPALYGAELQGKVYQHNKGRNALSFAPGRASRHVREMWFTECHRRTSQKWGLDGQLSEQLRAYLSELSYEGPQQQIALCYLWETADSEGILQQTLQEMAKIWRPALLKNCNSTEQEKTDSNASGTCCQGETQNLGHSIKQVIQETKGKTPTGYLVSGGNSFQPVLQGDEPSFVLGSSPSTNLHHRAFILSNAKTEYGDGIRDGGEPAGTVTGESNGRIRPFIVDCQKAGDTEGDRGVTLRQGDAPAFTVTGGKGGRQPVRAWLVGINANDSSGAKIYQYETEPAQTLRVPSGGRVFRAWLSQGRVVKLTPRALARLQSVPDNYILPDKSALACKVIGNGVACLMIEKIYRQLVG